MGVAGSGAAPPAGTVTGPLFPQLCLLAKCFKPALPYLDVDMVDICKENGAYDARHFLCYYYYGGMVYTGLKNFERALYFYEQVGAPRALEGACPAAHRAPSAAGRRSRGPRPRASRSGRDASLPPLGLEARLGSKAGCSMGSDPSRERSLPDVPKSCLIQSACDGDETLLALGSSHYWGCQGKHPRPHLSLGSAWASGVVEHGWGPRGSDSTGGSNESGETFQATLRWSIVTKVSSSETCKHALHSHRVPACRPGAGRWAPGWP